MESLHRLQGLTTDVKRAVDAFIKSDNVANYKDLQTSLMRLQVASSKPTDVLSTFRLQMIENAAIVMLVEMGVLDTLVAKQTATAEDLATATDYNEHMIARLMRVACALLFCEEIDERKYRANHITSLLVTPGWKGALQWSEAFYPIIVDIRRFLSATTFGRHKDQSTPSAFEFTHGKTLWKYLEESPDQRRNFDLWMRERRKHEERLWHSRFPPCTSLNSANLKKDPEAVLLVDVGGANGSQVIDFKAQFPNLPGRSVLQDLFPPTSNELLEQAEGVEVMAYDFFTPQPIKGARFYYFRNVLHNWPDEQCSEILQQVVLAMEPEYSTLLIDDFVLPSKNSQLHGAVEDILMMITLNALERTLEEYEKLLRAAGLEIVNVFATGGNQEAIIEAKVAVTADP